VQIPVVGEAARSFGEAQDQLAALLTGLRPIPRDALHISVYGVIPVAWESAFKEQRWNERSGAVLSALQRSCACAHAFALTFDKIRVDPLAVIAIASPSNPFIDQLRVELAALVADAGAPRSPYTIVHSTLARFSQSSLLDADLVAQAKESAPRATVNVTSARLVRERVYPSLELDVIAEYQLRPLFEGDRLT
jgi:hypothetical protein